MQCTAQQQLNALLDNLVCTALLKVKCDTCDNSDNKNSRDSFVNSSGREKTLYCTTRTILPD